MKTGGVALVVCLNIGTDPPDAIKPAVCARRECWFDPTTTSRKNGLEIIGNTLQQQYESWQSRAKYKQCLDPLAEDLRRTCINLRKSIKGDRLLLHYNGHGVPRPTINGELWVFGKHYTHYMPVSVAELKSWCEDPSIYVLDCSGAGVLIPHFLDNRQRNSSDGKSIELITNID
jgi:regulator-associated protein of mTOR